MANAPSHLIRLGYPGGDALALPDSPLTFAAGGNYGVEISSVNNLAILETVLALAEEYDVTVNRVDECRGIFRLPDAEIVAMVRTCQAESVGLIMSVGPRAIYDTGGFAKSINGARIGYRIRGMNGVAHALADVFRASSLGVRGFLVYDEGLLDVLCGLRGIGELPAETVFKLSVHAGCANPASARLFARVGADTINLVPDLDLPMIGAIREATTIPLDLFTDTAGAAGGFIRTYDVPDFVRIASPVFLKSGAVSQPQQNHLPTLPQLRERMKQTRCMLEMLVRSGVDVRQMNGADRTAAVPTTLSSSDGAEVVCPVGMSTGKPA